LLRREIGANGGVRSQHMLTHICKAPIELVDMSRRIERVEPVEPAGAQRHCMLQRIDSWCERQRLERVDAMRVRGHGVLERINTRLQRQRLQGIDTLSIVRHRVLERVHTRACAGGQLRLEPLAVLHQPLKTLLRHSHDVLELTVQRRVIGDDESQRHLRGGVYVPLILEGVVIDPQNEPEQRTEQRPRGAVEPLRQDRSRRGVLGRILQQREDIRMTGEGECRRRQCDARVRAGSGRRGSSSTHGGRFGANAHHEIIHVNRRIGLLDHRYSSTPDDLKSNLPAPSTTAGKTIVVLRRRSALPGAHVRLPPVTAAPWNPGERLAGEVVGLQAARNEPRHR
jgi:hypothetical protein